MRVILLIIALSIAATAIAQDPRIAPVLPYGIGLQGTGKIVPVLGTGGELPRVGNANFKIELSNGLGGVLCLIAVSLERRDQAAQGMTLHGDFETPGRFWYRFLMMSGNHLAPGQGAATLLLPVPNDPTLVGVRFYFQGFIGDVAASSAIAHSHTAGLQITVIQ
jgi:hypothetical protein